MAQLHEVSIRLAREDDLPSLLERFLDAAIRITGADRGNLQLLDESGGLTITAQRGFDQPFLDYFNRVHTRESAACSSALSRRERVIVEDVASSALFAGAPAREVLLEAGVRAVQSTPLLSRTGRVLGMVSTHYRVPCRPEERDLKLLDLLARQAVDTLERTWSEQALTASEARLRAVVETAGEAIITIDERGIVESVNPATEKLFGYRAEELIGHNIQILMPPPYREEHDRYLARYLQTGEKRIIGIGREVQGQRQDGSIFPLDLAVSEFRVQGRRLFMGAIRDISARKQLEREVLEVATLEQRRIGQALHDSTGQELSALALLAQTLLESLEKQAPPMTPLAVRIGEGLQRVLSQVRAYSRGLIPVEVDTRGLRVALTGLASRTSELHGLHCHFDCPDAVEVADNQTATHLYHIAQEAVTNALRHAQARQISISLDRDGPLLVLRVQDDGIGLPAESGDSKGMGLKIMAYRAGLIQARLNVERGETAGTIVTCTLSQHQSSVRSP
jgi:PAS domain S-box-containing protein